MTAENRRQTLGRFVRAHRERIRPDNPGRRRTPGLRREELAERAGISMTWCAWIEQGRDVNASPHALARLARALSLTAPERAYLFELAGRRDPDSATAPLLDDAPASVRLLVEGSSCPAYGLDRAWNACCWNVPAAKLFTGWLDTDWAPNLLRFMFTTTQARELVPDWEDRARRLVAEFRAEQGNSQTDPLTQRLITQLREESPDFAAVWTAQDVSWREGGQRRFRRPSGGTATYRQFTYHPADRPDYKVVLLMPDTGGGISDPSPSPPYRHQG